MITTGTVSIHVLRASGVAPGIKFGPGRTSAYRRHENMRDNVYMRSPGGFRHS